MNGAVGAARQLAVLIRHPQAEISAAARFAMSTSCDVATDDEDGEIFNDQLDGCVRFRATTPHLGGCDVVAPKYGRDTWGRLSVSRRRRW